MIDSSHSSRPLARFATLFLLGVCFALWPLVGYAATAFVYDPGFSAPMAENPGKIEAEDGVDSIDQIALVVAKSANTHQATAGTTIIYTYRITNTGSVTLTTITATDNRLGAVPGLAGTLAPGATRSTTRNYVVQAGDVGQLVNTVTVTGTDSLQNSITGNASETVIVSGPTALPGTQQPNQPRRQMFLPMIEP